MGQLMRLGVSIEPILLSIMLRSYNYFTPVRELCVHLITLCKHKFEEVKNFTSLFNWNLNMLALETSTYLLCGYYIIGLLMNLAKFWVNHNYTGHIVFSNFTSNILFIILIEIKPP